MLRLFAAPRCLFRKTCTPVPTAAHADGGIFTLLYTDGQPGLHICTDKVSPPTDYRALLQSHAHTHIHIHIHTHPHKRAHLLPLFVL